MKTEPMGISIDSMLPQMTTITTNTRDDLLSKNRSPGPINIMDAFETESAQSHTSKLHAIIEDETMAARAIGELG